MSISEASRILGVHRVTLLKWIRQGKVRAYMLGNRWRIPYSEIERLLKGFPIIVRVAIYCRVSNVDQRDDLERQEQVLKEYVTTKLGVKDYIVIKDVGSGLDTNRKGLRTLIELARKKQIDAVVVAYKDRLTRFGFEYLEELFKAYGVQVIVAFQSEPKEYLQEIIEDLIAIITSLARKIYGKRSHKYKKVIANAEKLFRDP